MKIKVLTLVITVLNCMCCFGQQVQLNKKLSYTIDSLQKTEPIRSAYDLRSTEREAKKIAKKNFPIIKAILDKYGFPGYDLVGETSSKYYCWLVMHSGFDVKFQKKALTFLDIQLHNKNASAWNYITLVDLINIEIGEKQIYGTQTTLSDTGFAVKPLIDPANVDARRKAMGINASLASSLKLANGFYKAYKAVPLLSGRVLDDTAKH